MLARTGIAGTLSASGHSAILGVMFGARLKIDEIFTRGFLSKGAWEVNRLHYEILKARAGVSDLQIISEVGSRTIGRNEMFAALQVLNSAQGAKVLQIPAGEKEAEVILGYVGGSVIYLEHEQKDGKAEEYNLHIRPQKYSWKRAVAVFVWK